MVAVAPSGAAGIHGGRIGKRPLVPCHDDRRRSEMGDLDTKERRKLAEEGKALPDGSFPIRNREDLKDAVQSFGRANDKDEAKRWIKKRARELNAEDELPENW
jgi:hypothetical protein